MEVDHPNGPGWRSPRDGEFAEETRVASASPEAGTLAGGTARRPRRDGRARGGVSIEESHWPARREVNFAATGRPGNGSPHVDPAVVSGLVTTGWTVSEPGALQQFAPPSDGGEVSQSPARMKPGVRTCRIPTAVPAAIRADPARVDLGWPPPGDGPAQADRTRRRTTPRAGSCPTITIRSASSSDGPLAGTTLRELVRSRPMELLGPPIGRARPVPAAGQVHRRRTRTCRSRSTRTTRRAAGWPATMARPRPG